MRYCDKCGEPLLHHSGHGYWDCENPECDYGSHYFNRSGELIRVTKVVVIGENNGKQHII